MWGSLAYECPLLHPRALGGRYAVLPPKKVCFRSACVAEGERRKALMLQEGSTQQTPKELFGSDEQTQAQRGSVACSKPHIKLVEDSQLENRVPNTPFQAKGPEEVLAVAATLG